MLPHRVTERFAETENDDGNNVLWLSQSPGHNPTQHLWENSPQPGGQQAAR